MTPRGRGGDDCCRWIGAARLSVESGAPARRAMMLRVPNPPVPTPLELQTLATEPVVARPWSTAPMPPGSPWAVPGRRGGGDGRGQASHRPIPGRPTPGATRTIAVAGHAAERSAARRSARGASRTPTACHGRLRFLTAGAVARDGSHRRQRIGLRAVPPPVGVARAHRFQPSQSQTARPITSSRSRPRSQGSSSVNKVTHWRHEQGMRVMSVPQNHRVGPKAS